jgi:hypothetical protein
MITTATLIYMMAGAVQTKQLPDMPHCIIAMENLPFVERARARCETQGITVHWKDVRPADTVEPAEATPVTMHNI